MTINKHNYHSADNPYISNSKVSCFLESKEQYKRRYIDRSEQFVQTPSMLIGSMVDVAFSNRTTGAIAAEYSVKVFKKDDVTLYERQKNDDYEFTIVTETQWDTAFDMATKLLDSDLYRWYKKPGMRRYFQKVLIDKKFGICGMLDVLTIDPVNKIAYIDDLKTSANSSLRTVRSWYWHCLDYAYFRQMFLYRLLVKERYPDYEVVCRHLVMGSAKPHPVKLFIFDDKMFWNYHDFFFKVVKQIKDETEWKDPVPTWDEAELITEL